MCGMTRLEDIAQAVDLGVDAIGFVFYSKSARHVSKEQVKPLIKTLPPFVDVVAVLVDPDEAFVRELLEELPIQLLQFQGDESPDFCQQFNKPFIKAIQAQHAAQIQQAMEQFSTASAILLDTPSQTEKGGTGVPFNWQLIPENLPKPYLLAGGLNACNVLDALKQCKPYAVDVCSGIEHVAGIKDHEKMAEFMNAIWGKP